MAVDNGAQREIRLNTETLSENRRLGLSLFESVTSGNLVSIYLSAMLFITVAVFLSQAQAFLLIETIGVPEDERGGVSGYINFWGEIVIIATVGMWGALSDRVGRRFVMFAGFVIVAASFWIYPKATSVGELLSYRLIYAVGIAAVSCMVVTIVADYVQDKSRGKALGYVGVMNGLGAMIATFVLLKLPKRFVDSGMSPAEAGVSAFLIAMVIAIVMAVIVWFGLQKDPPEHHEERPGVVTMFVEGIKAAKDPGIALAYGASFVARGNLAVVGTFAAVWLTTYGEQELGMTGADALSKAGMIIGISYAASLLGAPVFGIMTDRMNRVSALVITLAITFVGYGGMFFVVDPFGGQMIFFMILVGLSEVGCIITSSVLIAQQSPLKIRGSVIGIFNLTGAIGILVASLVGGYLMDHWLDAGPFVFFGLVALVVMIWAILVRSKVKPVAVETE